MNKAISWNISTFTEMSFIHWRYWGTCNAFLLCVKTTVSLAHLLIFKSSSKVNFNYDFDGRAGFMHSTKNLFFYINIFCCKFIFDRTLYKDISFRKKHWICRVILNECIKICYMSCLCCLACSWIKMTWNNAGQLAIKLSNISIDMVACETASEWSL